MATMVPAMGCGATISISIAWLCADSDVDALAGGLEAFEVLLQPPHSSVMRSGGIKTALVILR